MLGSKSRAQVTETVQNAIEKAGGFVALALVIAGAALVVSVVALHVASRSCND